MPGVDKVEINQVWDYYPGLFDEEKELYLKKKETDELEEFKNRRREFAKRFNKNRRKGDDG